MLHAGLLIGPRAKGTVGKTFTAANVKGKGVLKIMPVPTYTNSTDQSLQRGNFKDCVDAWHSGTITSADKIAYNVAATKRASGLSGWNLFMRYYRKAYSAGLTLAYLTGVTATVGAPNLTVAGAGSENGAILINIYSSTGTLIKSVVDAVAANVFSVAIALADIPASGFAEVVYTGVVNGGRTGYFKYSV